MIDIEQAESGKYIARIAGFGMLRTCPCCDLPFDTPETARQCAVTMSEKYPNLLRFICQGLREGAKHAR